MKRSKLEDTSYWPGYVDALVNVVLNILFLVGLMAVGLVSLNVEALGNFKSAKQAEQLQKISEDNLLLASLGTLLSAIPTQVKTVAEVKEAIPKAAPVLPSKPIETTALAQPTVQPPPVLRVGVPFVFAPVNQEQAFLQSKAGVSVGPNSQVIVFDFDALQYPLSAAQTNELKQQHAAAPGETRWSILVTVPETQERVSREAFLRMSGLRQWLITQGVSADAISLRTIVQDRVNFSNGRRVFVYLQTRPAAVAN